MMASHPNTRVTSPSPTDPISPSAGLEPNNSAASRELGASTFSDIIQTYSDLFTRTNPPSQLDDRLGCAAGNHRGHSFWGTQVHAFQTYPEIPPWMMNPGYAAIPNFHPDVSLPSNRSFEGLEAPPPETMVQVHNETQMSAGQPPEIFHSDRRSDPQQ